MSEATEQVQTVFGAEIVDEQPAKSSKKKANKKKRSKKKTSKKKMSAKDKAAIDAVDPGDAVAIEGDPPLDPIDFSLPAKQPENPMALLANVDMSKIDADKLERMMGMQERWEDRQAEKAFNKAMRACQADIGVILKKHANTQTNSKYAKLEEITHATKPALDKHGFSVCFSQHPDVIDRISVIGDVSHVDGHTRRYYGPAAGPDNKGPKGSAVKTEMHGITGSVTYLRRYLLCNIFNIVVAGEDLDGNAEPEAKPNRDETKPQEQTRGERKRAAGVNELVQRWCAFNPQHEDEPNEKWQGRFIYWCEANTGKIDLTLDSLSIDDVRELNAVLDREEK